MTILVTIFSFLILIGTIITIHEGGHYIMARRCNIKILEFSIGFGKVIFSKAIGKDKTLFTLRALPLGGFVKPLEKGLFTPTQWEQLEASDRARSLNEASRTKKALMVAGGPLFNFILAFVLYCVASIAIGVRAPEAIVSYVVPNSVVAQSGIQEGQKIIKVGAQNIRNSQEAMYAVMNNALQKKKVAVSTPGGEHTLDFSNIDVNALTKNPQKITGLYLQTNPGELVLQKIEPGSVAEKAGFLAGDVVRFIDEVAIKDASTFLRLIGENAQKTLNFSVARDGEEKNIIVSPVAQKIKKGDQEESVGRIGASFSVENKQLIPAQRYEFMEGVSFALHKVWADTSTTLVSFKNILTGQLSIKAMSGPLAIADYSGRSAQAGLYYYLSVMAAISVAIGVFNLLPIPMLDGGLLLQYAVEAIRGRDLPHMVLAKAQSLGISVLMGVFAIIMINDVLRLFS